VKISGQEKQIIYVILTICNHFINLFKDFKLVIMLHCNTDSKEGLLKHGGVVVQDRLLKSRCMPSGRCLVPVIGDDHQNEDFFSARKYHTYS